MDLSYNFLTGSLPASWGNTSARFGTFSLAGNFLTGTLPGGPLAAVLLNASEVDLSGNNFTGPVPAAWFTTPPALVGFNNLGYQNATNGGGNSTTCTTSVVLLAQCANGTMCPPGSV